MLFFSSSYWCTSGHWPNTFCANLYLFTYFEKYISDWLSTNLVKVHRCLRRINDNHQEGFSLFFFVFLDDFCAINDGDEFGSLSGYIFCSGQIESWTLKCSCITFKSLPLKIVYLFNTLSVRLFPFVLFICSFACSNIDRNIFYSVRRDDHIFTRSTLKFQNFKSLFGCMNTKQNKNREQIIVYHRLKKKKKYINK